MPNLGVTELLVIAILALWLPLGLVTVIIAWQKKYSLGSWFLYALLVSPIAFLHVLLLKAVRCPHCAEVIRVEATVCPHCRRDL